MKSFIFNKSSGLGGICPAGDRFWIWMPESAQRVPHLIVVIFVYIYLTLVNEGVGGDLALSPLRLAPFPCTLRAIA